MDQPPPEPDTPQALFEHRSKLEAEANKRFFLIWASAFFIGLACVVLASFIESLPVLIGWILVSGSVGAIIGRRAGKLQAEQDHEALAAYWAREDRRAELE